MKIYYLVNARIPTEKAHGIQLAKMCEAFVLAGHEVELVVPNRSKDRTSLKDFYKLKVDIPVVHLPIFPTYNWGRLGFWLVTASFMVSYLFYFWIKRLQGEKFIIYTSDIDQFSFLFIRLIWAKYFSEFHDYKPKTWPFTFFLGGISGVITINNIIKEKLKETYKLPDEKFIVEPNGIDLEMFAAQPDKSAARAKLGLPQDKKIVLYVGQFYDWKGLGILAEAAKVAPRLRSGTNNLVPEPVEGQPYFSMVGGTLEELKKVTGRTDFSENIICAGARPYEEMPLWMAAADVLLVLGTKTNDYSYYSTSPMKLFEYMAAKRPILAAKTPAISDVVSEQEVIFYEPDNAGSLSDKISYILDNPEESEKRSFQAFEAVKKYEWRERTKRICVLIQKSNIKNQNDK
jgi:glycosyltransferase involved in cell wall biosynthesis